MFRKGNLQMEKRLFTSESVTEGHPESVTWYQIQY